MQETGFFLFIVGLILGLGSVTVIDILGFLGRMSPYWTETTIRAHKVTKPLIWIGMIVAVCGGVLLYSEEPLQGFVLIQIFIAVLLVINGLFLSFYVSPFLLKQEREGKSRDLLPMKLQYAIVGSFLVSFFGWWTSVVLFVRFITQHSTF